jgi:hypothetical protein
MPEQAVASRRQRTWSTEADDHDDSMCYGLAHHLWGMLFLRGRGMQARGAGRPARRSINLDGGIFAVEEQSAPCGDITIEAWELGGRSFSSTVTPLVLSQADVVVVVLNLFKGCFAREEVLQEAASIFATLDHCLSQAHAPRLHGQGNIIIVGTFRDQLSEDQQGAIRELSSALFQRLRGSHVLRQVCLPPNRPGELLFCVGFTPSRKDDLAAIRRAVCEAARGSDAGRRNKPTMWLEALDRMRMVPLSAEGETGEGAWYKQVVSMAEARTWADAVAKEMMMHPMGDGHFALFLQFMVEMGEIIRLDDPSEPALCLRPELILETYREVRVNHALHPSHLHSLTCPSVKRPLSRRSWRCAHGSRAARHHSAGCPRP